MIYTLMIIIVFSLAYGFLLKNKIDKLLALKLMVTAIITLTFFIKPLKEAQNFSYIIAVMFALLIFLVLKVENEKVD